MRYVLVVLSALTLAVAALGQPAAAQSPTSYEFRLRGSRHLDIRYEPSPIQGFKPVVIRFYPSPGAAPRGLRPVLARMG